MRNRSQLLRPLRLRAGERGFYLIGLLMALAIVFILVGKQYYGTSNINSVPQAQYQIQKSTDTVCLTNRGAVRTDVTTLLAMNGTMPSETELANRLYGKLCPEGGAYQIDDRGNVYCELHAPAPEGTNVVATVRP
jgi:hypothetical protein